MRPYVIVRCKDAGVHAGVLESYHEREAILTEARRLWYWEPANKATFLSGVAVDGLSGRSQIGKPVPKMILTETCEITYTTAAAEKSIREHPDYVYHQKS